MTIRSRWRTVLFAALGALLLVLGLAPAPAQGNILLHRNDYNRDGISDLLATAVYGSDRCLHRWDGNGSGGFRSRVQVGCGWGSYFLPTSPGDLNRDGKADLVAIRKADRCLYRWYGNGSGGFGSSARVGCGWDSYARSAAGMEFLGVDIDGDLDGDLVALNQDNNCLYRWFGNGSGGFGTSGLIGCGWSDRSHITSPGGINNDGYGDLAAIVGDGTTDYCLERWLGYGNGGFGYNVVLRCGDWVAYNSIRGMGDLNDDGYGDLVGVKWSDDCLWRWYGTGGGFGLGQQLGCGWAPYDLVS